MIIDTHCHLDFPDFDQDRDSVVARAREAGLSHMVTISTRVRKFSSVLTLIETYDDVFGTVGTHPNHVHEEGDVTLDDLLELSQHPKVVAIGEVGLDYYRDTSYAVQQRSSFLLHIEAARHTGLPLIIHSRACDEDMEALLVEETRKAPFLAVLHCFTGSRALALKAVELGHYVSFSGILTFKKSQELRDLAREIPMDRLFVETDAPYLAPGVHRGGRNEPSYVVETAKVLADVKGVSYEEIARQTTHNALTFFTKMAR